MKTTEMYGDLSPPQLQKLRRMTLDCTSHDLNLQMQQLLSDYKKTGDEHYKLDAEYLRSEFESWWNDESLEFVPPAQD
jgi:hypothetical protein